MPSLWITDHHIHTSSYLPSISDQRLDAARMHPVGHRMAEGHVRVYWKIGPPRVVKMECITKCTPDALPLCGNNAPRGSTYEEGES